MKKAHCLNCYAKDVQILVLKQRLALLEKQVKRLRGIINYARLICAKIIKDSQKVLSQHQPRSVWAYASAAQRAARMVLAALG